MRWRSLFTGWLLLAAVAAFAQAGANDVRIQVDIQRGSPQKTAANANVVVWLTPVGDAPRESPEPTHVQLVQKNKQFEPHLLVLPVGSLVDFPNKDPFFHNVFSLYNGKRFDLGFYESGSSRSVKFDRPGVSFIFCNIHPEMSAAVIALDTRYFAVSNAAGEVNIPHVPSGRYRLQVWYERSMPEALAALSREIAIPSDAPLPVVHVPEAFGSIVTHKNKYGKDYPTTAPYGPPR
jgi:plastocyanin